MTPPENRSAAKQLDPEFMQEFIVSLRERAQRVIDNPQMPNGGSESGEEAWYWTHKWLAQFAEDVIALLTYGEIV